MTFMSRSMAWTVPSEQDDKRRGTAKEEKWKNRGKIREEISTCKAPVILRLRFFETHSSAFRKFIKTTLLLLLKGTKSPSTSKEVPWAVSSPPDSIHRCLHIHPPRFKLQRHTQTWAHTVNSIHYTREQYWYILLPSLEDMNKNEEKYKIHDVLKAQ